MVSDGQRKRFVITDDLIMGLSACSIAAARHRAPASRSLTASRTTRAIGPHHRDWYPALTCGCHDIGSTRVTLGRVAIPYRNERINRFQHFLARRHVGIPVGFLAWQRPHHASPTHEVIELRYIAGRDLPLSIISGREDYFKVASTLQHNPSKDLI
ncbi:MAG: hypothetical protein ACRDRI_05020 [Pseudonocardiaceae bacterium]